MHKLLLNTLSLKAVLRPRGPILIKSGSESAANPTLPNMNFVRSTRSDGRETIYLPGSSLKGVIRSHAERVARTVDVHCCDPLDEKLSCGKRTEKSSQDGAQIYQEMCTACRMFGHTTMASRIFIQDAYPRQAINRLPVRQMVAIDRRSGSSANPFTMEVATEGEFEVDIVMRNFERWQVGLLALVLRDLREGYLRVGFGKSRGLGQVELTFEEVRVNYTGVYTNDERLYALLGTGELGKGKLLDEKNRDLTTQYGFLLRVAPPEHAEFPDDAQIRDEWMGAEIIVTGDASIEYLLRSQVDDWQQYVKMPRGSA